MTNIAQPEGDSNHSHDIQVADDVFCPASFGQKALPILELPTDRPRPPIQTYRGATMQFVLDAELTEGITTLSRSQGMGRYMTLLAGFGALLHRYSGQSDLVIGFPTAGRSDPAMAGIVGYLVNPVALKLHFERETDVTQLLSEIRHTVLNALEHQDYPCSALVESLQIDRAACHSPVFQSMFVWQKEIGATVGMPGAHAEAGSLNLEVVAVEPGASQFDLTLLMGSVEAKIAATLKYNADLFDRPTMERLIAHYLNILRAMVAEPEQKVAKLALLTPEERHNQLVTWNDTAAPGPVEQNLAEAFVARARRTPDAVAVKFRGVSLTYHELNRRSDTVAQHLVAAGVGPEVIVALYLERSLEMIVALLAIAKAGGAYLPIDLASPLERVRVVLEDSRTALFLTSIACAERLGASIPNTVFIETLLLGSAESESYQGNGAGRDSLAYVLYTSGSTGTPKGVMVTNGSVLNLSLALQKAIYAGRGERLRVSLNAPLAFDASVEQLVQLLHGHCLTIVPEELRRDPQALLQFILTEQINVMDCTPGLLKPLIRAGLFAQCNRNGTVFLVGGEAIDPDLWRTLRQAEGSDFYNVYGPTECTVNTTVCNIREAGNIPTIGRPLANTHAYIVDDHLQLVPVGVSGELVIGGAGVARGYLNRPIETQQRFIDDPFDASFNNSFNNSFNDLLADSSTRGARLYRTGDRARYLVNGTIEFLGRFDHQVKIRGYRVELEEIEFALKQHPDITDAVVICHEDASKEQTLVAYFEQGLSVSPYHQELHHEKLRAFLKSSLPDYMVPATFMQVESLPLTPHGKVDRAALTRVQATCLETVETPGVPRTNVEMALVEMWSQLLGLERIGIHDDFFELGGHSLLVVQMIGQLQALFPTDVPLLVLFFAQPTIAGLAEAIAESSAGQQNIDTMVQLLHKLANLTEEEIDEILYDQSSFDPID